MNSTIYTNTQEQLKILTAWFKLDLSTLDSIDLKKSYLNGNASSFIVNALAKAAPEIATKLFVEVTDILLEFLTRDTKRYIKSVQLLNKGKAARDIKNYVQAREYAEEVIKEMPEDHTAWSLRGYCLLMMGEFQEAEEVFLRIITLKKTIELYCYCAAAQIQLGKYRAALDTIECGLNLDRNFAELWVTKALVLEKLGNHSGAVEASKKVIDLDKEHVIELKDVLCLISGGNPSDWIYEAKILAKDEPKLALEYIDQALMVQPREPDYWILKADIHAQKNEYYEAGEAYSRAAEYIKQNEELLYEAGMNFFRGKYYAEALDLLQEALEKQYCNDHIKLEIGRCYRKLGNASKAIEVFQEFCNSNPENIAGFLEMGHTYRKERDLDAADTFYQKVLALEENNLEALDGRSRVSETKGLFVLALDLHKRVEHLSPIRTKGIKKRSQRLHSAVAEHERSLSIVNTKKENQPKARSLKLWPF